MAQGDQATRPMNFQVPEEMRTMAERSVTQARQALESYLQAARRTSESMEQTSDKVQAGTKHMAQKTLSAGEQNLRATLDYAQRLGRDQGHGPKNRVGGGAEPARLAGLCAAAGAGQGSARDHPTPVGVRADPNGGHAGPDERVRVGHAVRHGHREGPRAIGG